MDSKNSPRKKQSIFKNKWDVAIVGNGFAGNLLAASLACKGFKVIIVERKNQANHETRCGNMIHAKELERFGIKPPDFLIPIKSYEQVFLNNKMLIKRICRNGESGNDLCAFKRKDLDAYLENMSEKAGVELLKDFCVDEIRCQLTGPASIDSGNRTITADMIVLASGTEEQILKVNSFMPWKGSDMIFFAAQQSLHRNRKIFPAAAPQKNASLIQIMNIPHFYRSFGSLLFLEDNLIITVFGVIKSSSLSSSKFQPDFLIDELKKSSLLKETDPYDFITNWRSQILGPFPFSLRKPYKDRVILVGDSALSMGGSMSIGAGFNWAAQTAFEASEVIPKVIKNPTRSCLRSYAEKIYDIYRSNRSIVRPFSKERILQKWLNLYLGN